MWNGSMQWEKMLWGTLSNLAVPSSKASLIVSLRVRAEMSFLRQRSIDTSLNKKAERERF
jgi:hypothetical protein